MQSHKVTHQNSISWWFGCLISSGFIVDEEISGGRDVVMMNVVVTGFGVGFSLANWLSGVMRIIVVVACWFRLWLKVIDGFHWSNWFHRWLVLSGIKLLI